MPDNVTLNSGSGGANAAADEVTYSGDTAQVQVVRLVHVSGAEGSKTVTEVVGTAGSPGTAVVTVQGVASGTVVPVSDGGGNLSIDDGGNTITVDGTVTANLAAGTNNIGDVDVLTVPAPLSTTGGGTEAAALRVTVASDSTGVLSVDDNGGTLTIDNAALAVTGGGVEASALRVTLASDSTGVVSVDDNGGSLTVDGTVTAAQATAANLNATVVGTGTFAVQATLQASTNTTEVVGDAAHDAAVAGNPVLVCGVAQDMDDTAPPNRVSAEADATRLATDRDGAVFVHPYGPQLWKYASGALSSAQTDTQIKAAAGANLSHYITDIVFSSGAATAINLFLEEGASTIFGPLYLEAVAGRGTSIHFQTPLKVTANTAVTYTTSAAIAHSVSITGFTAQG